MSLLKITVEEMANSFKVRFPYNAQAVEYMRTIPGRQFRKDLGNCWLVPKTSQKALRRFIDKFSGKAAQAHIQKPYVDPKTFVPTCTKGPAHWTHQIAALQYLVNKDAALLDLPMGLGGKSRIIVDYICNMRIKRTLIVCPLAVIDAWKLQFEKYAGMPVHVVPLNKGSVAQKMETAFKVLKHHEHEQKDNPVVLVINYESVWRDPFGDFLYNINLDLFVMDEIQRTKGAGTSSGKFCYQIGAQIPTRIGLSGTPFPNSPLDAYGVYRALDPKIFGTNYKRFESRYAVLGGWENRQILGYINQDELKEKVNSIRFHVKPKDIELPDLVHVDIPIELPKEAKNLYGRLANDYYAQVESGEVTAANVAVVLTRLEQLTSGYLPIESEDEDGVTTVRLDQIHTAKRDALVELLYDLPAQEPVVVFCRFRYDLTQVREAAGELGRASLELSGKRHELAEWQAGKAPILAVQLRSGSVGVDLTRACYGVYFSYTFLLEDFDQSVARLHRPGQTRACALYHLIVRGSIDERIRKALERKRNVLNELLKLPVKA